MKLEELQVYHLSMEVGEKVWNIVSDWNYFDRDTIGKQLVRSIDSVAANLSEGFGRFHYKDSKNFSYYARGSLYETKTFLVKANKRALISDDELQLLLTEIKNIGIKLNNYIKTIGNTSEQKK